MNDADRVICPNNSAILFVNRALIIIFHVPD